MFVDLKQAAVKLDVIKAKNDYFEASEAKMSDDDN